MLSYLLIRLLTFPFAYLPYKAIHALGKPLGLLAYYLIPKFRKRALSNLALSNLKVDPIQTAKKSLQSLMITCLEYPRLAREKEVSRIASCDNPEEADAIMTKGKGVIFFCGHQANWELLFLEGTSRMPGVAIGRPIKNKALYNWVLGMRQKFGGTIITPKNALKEGLRALKKGNFLGIVGDQGMPDSSYHSPFLGREAYSSPAPAMLSYKTNTPLIVATTTRKNGKYTIHYEKALYPNPDAPMEQEVDRLMRAALSLYEESIRKNPHEWLWIHNRWKQQTVGTLKRRYRQDSIACILSEKLDNLALLRTLYPTEHITLFAPKEIASQITLDAEIRPYTHLKDLLIDDYRFKLLFNFTPNKKLDRHFKKLSAQVIARPKNLQELENLVRHAP
ncbi:MAG: hypothetical protein P0S96_04945 [Simkaniaceae bacterium]|nr:hypothetical protein [Candidatus Sacchlamyda saccharinae]